MRRRGLSSRTTTMPLSMGGRTTPDAAKIAVAPRLTASLIKVAPSALEPASAAKRYPGWTLRESSVRPATTGSGGMTDVPMSSLNRKAPHSGDRRLSSAAGSRQGLALGPAAVRRHRHHRGRRRGRHGHRHRGDLERRLLAPVARQDAVEGDDVVDDHLDTRRRDHAAGRIAASFRQAFRLIQRDQHEELGVAHREDANERAKQGFFGVAAAAADFFRGAGLAADLVALDLGLLARAL